jgi:hypothetical protein
MEIDPQLPHSVRERIAHQKLEAARAARCAEFAKLVRAGETRQAGEYFLATTEGEHIDLIRALEGDELPPFLRASTPQVRNRVLEIHPNPATLRLQMIDDKDVPRLIRVRHRDWIDSDDPDHQRRLLAKGQLNGCYWYSGSKSVTADVAIRLRDVGLGGLVKPPRSITNGYKTPITDAAGNVIPQRADPEPWRYVGITFEGCETWSVEALAVIREVDEQVDHAFADGTLVATPLSIEECRRRMSPLRAR